MGETRHLLLRWGIFSCQKHTYLSVEAGRDILLPQVELRKISKWEYLFMIQAIFPNTKPTEIIFPTKQTNCLAVENGYWARIGGITPEILSGEVEILRLDKSIQNINHTKKRVGCQIHRLLLGRKPADRSEDLTNVEAT